MLLTQLYMMFDILLPCGKHLYARIISHSREVWVNNTSLIPALLLEKPVSRREIGRSRPPNITNMFKKTNIFIMSA